MTQSEIEPATFRFVKKITSLTLSLNGLIPVSFQMSVGSTICRTNWLPW